MNVFLIHQAESDFNAEKLLGISSDKENAIAMGRELANKVTPAYCVYVDEHVVNQKAAAIKRDNFSDCIFWKTKKCSLKNCALNNATG